MNDEMAMTIENMFEDYLKDFLSKIGYKNLEFQNFYNDGRPILFSQKETELKHKIKVYLHRSPVSFYEILHKLFYIFSKYFIFNIEKGIDPYEHFHIGTEILEFQYFNNDDFCLAQKLYKIVEKDIFEPRFIIMNNIVSDGDFLEVKSK